MERSQAEEIREGFRLWLVELYERADSPPYRVLERRSRDRAAGAPDVFIGKSTIGALLTSSDRLPAPDRALRLVIALRLDDGVIAETRERLREARRALAAIEAAGAAGTGASAAEAGRRTADPVPAPAAAPGAAEPVAVPAPAPGTAVTDPAPGPGEPHASPAGASGAARAGNLGGRAVLTGGVALVVVGAAVAYAAGAFGTGHAAKAAAPPPAPARTATSAPSVTTSAPPVSSSASARPGDDQGAGPLRYTVEYEKEGFDLALPAGVGLTAEQRRVVQNLAKPGTSSTGPQAVYAQLRAEGGAFLQDLSMRITLADKGRRTIRVDDIEPVNVQRTPPLDGTFIDVPSQGEDPLTTMVFDFDDNHPVARTPNALHPQRPGGLYFAEHYLTVGTGEEDGILVTSQTTRDAVSFDIEADYRLDGRAGRLVIDDHGHPFHLTPVNCTRSSTSTSNGPVDGEAAYHSVWEMQNFGEPVIPAADPAHYRMGAPYC